MKLKILLIVCVVVIVGLLANDFYIYSQSNIAAEELVVDDSGVCGTGEGCSISDKRVKGFEVGNQIPNITLKDFEGNEILLYDLLEGKDKYIISFAADWCSDCERQDTKMKEYYETLPDNYGFAVVFAEYKGSSNTHETDVNQAKAYAKENDYPFPIFWDYDGEIASNFGGVKATPTNFLLDENGIIKAEAEEIDADILFLSNSEDLYVEDFSKLEEEEEV